MAVNVISTYQCRCASRFLETKGRQGRLDPREGPRQPRSPSYNRGTTSSCHLPRCDLPGRCVRIDAVHALVSHHANFMSATAAMHATATGGRGPYAWRGEYLSQHSRDVSSRGASNEHLWCLPCGARQLRQTMVREDMPSAAGWGCGFKCWCQMRNETRRKRATAAAAVDMTPAVTAVHAHLLWESLQSGLRDAWPACRIGNFFRLRDHE